MTRRTNAALLLLSGLLPGLLSACGVPPSGVVEVGEPATGMALSNAVYFLDREGRDRGAAEPADGVVLRAVPRPEIAGADPVASAVRQLLAGPTATESPGLTTALPPDIGRSQVTVATDRETGGVTISFPTGTPRLSDAALRQLSCTVALATRTQTPRPPATTPTAWPTPAGAAGGPAGPSGLPPPPLRITVQGTPDQATPATRSCDP